MNLRLASLRLRTKAAVIVGAILVCVLGLNTFLNVRVLVRELQASLQLKTTLLGDILVKDIRKVLDFGLSLKDIEDGSKRCKELVAEHQDLAYAMVVDPQGAIVYHNDAAQAGRAVPAGTLGAGGEPKEVLRTTTRGAAGVIHNSVIPIRDGRGQYAGAVVIGLKGSVISDRVQAGIRTALAAGTLSFLATLALIIFFISSQIGSPLAGLAAAAGAVAKGDLTQTIETRSRDEIFDLYQAFNHMLASLRELQGRTAAAFQELEQAVGAVTAIAGSLRGGAEKQSTAVEEIAGFITHMNDQAGTTTRSMENLARMSEETSSSIMEMIASIEQVAQNTDALSSSVSQTSASVEEVLSSNKEVAHNVDSLNLLIAKSSSAITQIDASIKEVQTLAQESRQISDEVRENAARDGGAAVQEAIGEMGKIRKAVLALSETVERLSGSVGNIGEILVVIDDVAEQTNLLALNAAIIAAQAGEHGRGFAVVADEIRELAERTSASTKEISKVITGIQTETRNVGALVKEGVDRVDTGVLAVGRTDQALRKIISSSEHAATMSTRIAEATAEQAKGSREVARSVQEVADRSTQIARATAEQARGSEIVMRSVETMRDMSEQVRRATVEQTSGARLIAKASENSTQLAQQVTKASQDGKQLSERAVSEVATIRGAAREVLDVVSQMRRIVENFDSLSQHIKKTLSQFRTS